MIPEKILTDMERVRKLLKDCGFTVFKKDPDIGLNSTINGYFYVNGKHHIDLFVHTYSFKKDANISDRWEATYVHYWGPDLNQHDWYDSLEPLIVKLQTGRWSDEV